ncbi:8855_t:CDS:2 [Funneliformis caledonium]|uniref:8855_t:CDS:1 n=1 Tax=Funneliformis caledonium TaxID=1117310 RepID=A0A9N8ZN88_9GLOM|nr:8855_t:CDS:2 [Funneliformis caledonium]
MEKLLLNQQNKPRLLEIIQHIKNAKNVVVIAGAGISVSGGIPDFRSPDGLFAEIMKQYPGVFSSGRDLFDGSRIFSSSRSITTFYKFMALLKQQVINARVTATHRHFAKLNNMNKLLRVYSQNVDNLEERAGLPVNDCHNTRSSERIIKLHGEIDNVWCNICHKTFPFSSDVINAFKDGSPPECQYCMEQAEKARISGKRIRKTRIAMLPRPNILLYNDFERTVGEEIGRIAYHDQRKADCLLIMGTSLKVSGCKSLVKDFSKAVHSRGGKVIFINTTEVTSNNWKDVIDVHIQGASDEWAELVEAELEKKEAKGKRRKRVCEENNEEQPKSVGRKRQKPVDKEDKVARVRQGQPTLQLKLGKRSRTQENKMKRPRVREGEGEDKELTNSKGKKRCKPADDDDKGVGVGKVGKGNQPRQLKLGRRGSKASEQTKRPRCGIEKPLNALSVSVTFCIFVGTFLWRHNL